LIIVWWSGSKLAYIAGIRILAYNMSKAKSSNDVAKNGNSKNYGLGEKTKLYVTKNYPKVYYDA